MSALPIPTLPTPPIIAPFERSVREVFQSMLATEVTTGMPFRKTEQSHSSRVSGVIGFSGELTGSVVIGFPGDVASKLIEKFSGAAVDETSPDFADAIGEITNIIAGCAKGGLGVEASISIPSVIIGTGYSVVGLSAIPCFVIPCTCAAGEFSIEVSVQKTGPKGIHSSQKK